MRSLSRWIFCLPVLAGCEAFAFADRDLIPIDHGGSGGATASTGGATVSAGSGGASGIPCTEPLDCPGQDSECRVRVCVEGTCGWHPMDAGTPTVAQVPGDCRKRVCDGAGSMTQIDDDADVLDDHDACTADLCVTGNPRHEPSIASACGIDGEGICDAQGSCVSCVTAAECSGGTLCAEGRCVPPSCLDLVRDGDETALDCGGWACGPCASDQACLRNRDCQSGRCSATTQRCEAPSCTDGVANGDETDVDCGGSCPMRCGPGARCALSDDCVGQRCSGAVCLPSCIDGKQNGAETGLDCGGWACAPCHDGGGCGIGDDCASGVCQSGVCVPPACVDGAKDGSETDVDCGGACAPCAPGRGCEEGEDCASRVCAEMLCAAPSCSDKTRNAAETGVDCGGPLCGACADGQGCAAPSDCASGVCAAGVCVEPSCTDGALDLAETDVDCGGGACPGCGHGGACLADADCASLRCLSGVCAASACDDHLKNGAESDVDCGGPCAPCALGKACLGHADCATVACAGGVCVPPACGDGSRNGQETGVDCGGPTCGACPGGQGCLAPADCASGICTGGACAASCTDQVHDGDETGVDCGGSCAGCPEGGPCAVDADCESAVCGAGACLPATCTDGVRNGGESDADCGGSACGACAVGMKCQGDADCATLGCRGGLCAEVLLISEVRSNGAHAGAVDDTFADDFIELYNPGNAPIVVDASWSVWHQSAQGSCQGKGVRYQGTGLTIPPRHHLLAVGLSYAGPPADAPFIDVVPGNSIADAASIWIEHAGQTVDALCYYYDATTLGRLTGDCPTAYVCEGTPVLNLPHNGTKDSSSSADVSLERRPGGTVGNAQDTGDSAADFQVISPANPQNLASSATP